MASSRTIQCQDCGQDYETKRASTKRCDWCRLLNELKYLQQGNWKPLVCELCDKEFMPLARQEPYCADCRLYTSKQEVGHCTNCESNEHRLLGKGLTICFQCATRPDQQFRGKLIKALKRKIDERAGV